MSTLEDNSLEALRLESPEELGRHRVYDIGEALVLLERSLNAIGLSLTDELPARPTVPQSEEVINHQVSQEASYVVAQAEQIAKDAAGLTEQRALENALNASHSIVEKNPLLNLGDIDAV